LPLLGLGPAHAQDADWLKAAFDDKPAIETKRPAATPGERAKRATLVGNHFAPSMSGKWQWKVTRPDWTETDEAAYGEFIRGIGESNCRTSHECLASPEANPKYAASNPPGMQFFADCADLPFVLRGYFAWMNGLPYSFPTASDLHPGSKSGKGDFPSFQITGRYHIVPPGPDGRIALEEMTRVSTAHFRTPADYRGRMLPDYYLVRIDRETIKAGTVVFNPLGHIAVVYKVTDEGVVHYIDAHPDNALTRGVFDSEFERGGPETGGGFKRWRPQKLVGFKRGPNGRLFGGRLELAPDKDLADRSDEQYLGNSEVRSQDGRSARFMIDGEEVDYFGFIRLRLARPGYKFNPIAEMRLRMRTLCQELRYRVDAVDAAVKAGIHLKPQPPRLPQNIYVTQGYWEAYATPSRDAQLRASFAGLREEVVRFLELTPRGSRFIEYKGEDIRADLAKTHAEEASACSVTYTKSNGARQTLSFAEIEKRLFRLSFDPHHCVERRWGASDPDELGTCKDDALKTAWYEAEQRLRNQIVRTIGDRMDFTLDDLKRQALRDDEVGESEPPAIDVVALVGK
jgi:hypothetical protein